MDPNPARPEWLSLLNHGSHACFFYTTTQEYFSIALDFLREGLSSQKERCLWILPPKLSLQEARANLQQQLSFDPLPLMKLRRLLLFPWERWYGLEFSIATVLGRSRQIFKETLKDGYKTLRVLGHSPEKSSDFWREFLIFEESLAKSSIRQKPVVSLCGYSLIDCPAAAIPSIAASHDLCLIHHGCEWEWLANKHLQPRRTLPSNLLQSYSLHYRHSR